MKKSQLKNLLFASVALTLFVGFFSACGKDDNKTEPADTSKFTALVDSCQTILNGATTTDYPQSAITTFSNVLTTAKTAAAKSGISQTEVDNLVVQLRAAKDTFLAAAYGAIPSSALIMGMTFDETVANSQFKTEGKGWTAVLKQGESNIYGTSTNLPSFITGKVGKAIYFNNGSHLEISDYTSSDLLGNTLSIAAWVKPDSTRAGNYIISYNYWNTWKFQLQEQNKPFFTAHTATGYTDADNQSDFSAPNSTWTHLVVTMDLTNGKLVFYVNGVSTMEWTSETKPNFTGALASYSTTLPLMIGACTTYAEAVSAWTWDWAKTPANWDTFVGAIDELKVYNIALTDGQVAKLYKDENK